MSPSADHWNRGLGDPFAGDDGAGLFSALFSPVDPWNRWPLLTPLVSVAGAVTVVAAAGVGAAAMMVAGLALLLVVFLLSEVFGYEVLVPGMPVR